MAIPVFDIDLDEDPALRWRAVAAAGAHLIRRVGLRWDLGGNSSQFVQVLVVLPIWDILPLSWSNRTEGTVRGDKNLAQAYAPHLRKLAEAWLLVLSPALGGGAVVCFRVSWELRRVPLQGKLSRWDGAPCPMAVTGSRQPPPFTL